MTKEEIQSIFGSRIVSFHAIFAKAIGSVPAAVMLSQAFFWQEKAKNKDGVRIGEEMFFSKTGEEWYDETGLTESQQLTARKHLLIAGFWVEQRAGLPAKMCYRIDVEALVAVISRYLKTGQQVAVDNRKQSREITRTSSGKFRQLETVKNGNNIKVESKRELKREEEEKAASLSSSPRTNISLEAEKKEKELPPVAPPPPLTGPFTQTGETIGPEPQKVVRLYDPQLPGVTLIEPAPMPQYQADPRSSAPAPIERVSIPDEIERLRTDPAAKETFAMVRKIPSNLYADYLEAFDKEVKGTGQVYFNVPAFRKHFFNWCGIRYSMSQNRTAKLSNNRSHITHGGSDMSKYSEPQKF